MLKICTLSRLDQKEKVDEGEEDMEQTLYTGKRLIVVIKTNSLFPFDSLNRTKA